ncbi:hypothetical protein KQH82_12285 [bacterium]|nr:hypothetical protein [bacterium]
MSRLLVILACLVLAVTSLFPASKPSAPEQAIEATRAAAKELPDSLVCGSQASTSSKPLR